MTPEGESKNCPGWRREAAVKLFVLWEGSRATGLPKLEELGSQAGGGGGGGGGGDGKGLQTSPPGPAVPGVL